MSSTLIATSISDTGRGGAPEACGETVNHHDGITRRSFMNGLLTAGSGIAAACKSLRGWTDPAVVEAAEPWIINTIVGGGPIGDGLVATKASLSTPLGVSLDGAGNLYIADSYFHRIRMVAAGTNIILTVAGSGIPGYGGDGGPATAATMILPYNVVPDLKGNLFIADNGNSAVRRVDKTTGIITSFVGNGRHGFNGDGIPPSQAQLSFPRDVAFDRAGNLYIADTINFRVRFVNMGHQPVTLFPGSSNPLIVQPGVIATAAGNGQQGQGGDGGLATQAQLRRPAGIALDSNDNLYIADEALPRVRRVDAISGIITTVAGTGVVGTAGDGGPAINATVGYPTSVGTDSAGNLYIVDEATPRVRQVNTGTGIIRTVVGGTAAAFTGDGGPAFKATLNAPMHLVFDASNNMFIADYSNARVRRVLASTQKIDTVAGSSNVGDLGPALSAILNEPAGMAMSARGLLIADEGNHRIRVVGTSGTIATVAGDGRSGFSGDGGPATGARLNLPTDVKTDAQGNIYIDDLVNQRIRRVDGASGDITTIVGTGVAGFGGDGGPAKSALLNFPRCIALDATGNLYIADLFNLRMRFVNTGTQPVTLYSASSSPLTVRPGQIVTAVGTGSVGATSGDGGPALSATIDHPRAVAIDFLGNVYVGEGGVGATPTSRIRRVDIHTGIITTVAGVATGQAGYNGDNILATNAELNGPRGLVFDRAGNFYIADTFNQRVRRVDALTGLITTVVGAGAIGFSGDGGEAVAAEVFFPRYVILDNSGNLVVTDQGNSRIRRVTLS